MPSLRLWLWYIVGDVLTVQSEHKQLSRERILVMAACKCYTCDLYRTTPVRPSQAKKMMKSRKAPKDEHKQRLRYTDKTGFAAIRAYEKQKRKDNLWLSI